MTVTEAELSPAALELLTACREYPGLDPRDPLEAIADPQWDSASRTNDWRNAVNPTAAVVLPLPFPVKTSVSPCRGGRGLWVVTRTS